MKKPCPFCGSDQVSAKRQKSRYTVQVYVLCLDCNARGPRDGFDTDHAWEKWNDRIGDQANNQ